MINHCFSLITQQNRNEKFHFVKFGWKQLKNQLSR